MVINVLNSFPWMLLGLFSTVVSAVFALNLRQRGYSWWYIAPVAVFWPYMIAIIGGRKLGRLFAEWFDDDDLFSANRRDGGA